jgi:hypothetical protein
MLNEKSKKTEILYILNNLRKEDRLELYSLFGKNWKEETINNLKNKKVNILYGYDKVGDKKPIAMGGFDVVGGIDSRIACVWLLSTPFVSKNQFLFFKELKHQFRKAETRYDIMYNFIYKSNKTAKSWLGHFGFKFDNPKGIFFKENFEFFYKVIERKK